MPVQGDVTSAFCQRFTRTGTFHIAEKGSETNPDGSKNYVYLPQRNHRDLASRQMHVRRVPGRAARGDGKQVFYIRMKRPTAELGDTWSSATDEADTLASKQLGIRGVPAPAGQVSSVAAAREVVASPSAVLASTGEQSIAAAQTPVQHARGSSAVSEASDSDAEGAVGGWQRKSDASGSAALPHGASPQDSTQRDLQQEFAGEVAQLPV